MTLTLSQIQSWRPESMREVASTLDARLDRLEQRLRRAEQDLDEVTSSWDGHASEAMSGQVQREIRSGRRVQYRGEDIADALRSGAGRLQSVRDHLLARVGDARGAGFTVSDTWEVRDPRKYQLLTDLAERVGNAGLVAAHAESIGRALQQVYDEDHQVSFAVDSALDEWRATGIDAATGEDYAPPAVGSLDDDEAAALFASDDFRRWTERHPDAAKSYLDRAVDQGRLDPHSPLYTRFIDDYWDGVALEAAGIEAGTWDVTRGAAYNSETITAVYEYYGNLFLENPEMTWAGMANLIGPSFAGGFYDLDMVRSWAQSVEGGIDRVPDLPGSVDDDLRERLGGLASLSDEDLNYYQTTLLAMQKEIFLDQASMHEAYLLGGTAEIDRMTDAGLLDAGTRNAWRDIDEGQRTGDQELIDRGNKQLLYREQWDIIADDYDRMRDHSPTGDLVTWGITAVGAPSIPEAQGYADVFPEVIDLGDTPRNIGPLLLPSTSLGEVVTPLPDGNIANAEQRWNLIEEDTLPAYLDLVHDDPDRLRDLVASDFDERVEQSRPSNNIGDIAEDFLTDWQYRR
ncbi:hypothetical protein GCM10027020_33990 [Nocardioides salsibiostraticola]